MQLPDKVFLRRGEVMGFLGITKQVMQGLVESKALRPVKLHGSKWAYFRRVEVMALATPTPDSTKVELKNRGALRSR